MRENLNSQIEEVVPRIAAKNYLVEIDQAWNLQVYDPFKMTIPVDKIFTVYEDDFCWEISTNHVLVRFGKVLDGIEIFVY